MIVFTRTRQATDELAERLQARGFAAAALNGDIQQASASAPSAPSDGKIDILVATDVAARGLDVERVSHVINYDVPTDSESYVHRIGRTGRAGRSGEAILFIAPRERGLLKIIERATRQPIELMALPTVKQVNDNRVARFKQAIRDVIAGEDLEVYQRVIDEFEKESETETAVAPRDNRRRPRAHVHHQPRRRTLPHPPARPPEPALDNRAVTRASRPAAPLHLQRHRARLDRRLRHRHREPEIEVLHLIRPAEAVIVLIAKLPGVRQKHRRIPRLPERRVV
jgi:ATP-dependent RNA helicase DeaD